MWARDTFHNCAEELRQLSDCFRRAFATATPLERKRGNQNLLRYSNEGVVLLRSIALAVRSDQDYRLIPETKQIIGALLQPAHCRFEDYEASYCPPFRIQDGFRQLILREGLNKVAHLNPNKTGYRVSDRIHEIIIGGNQHGEDWIAVISILHLCDVIVGLPDHRV